MAEPRWEDFPNFGRHEFVCHCGCGRADMDAGFMATLQRLRTSLGFPFVISSGYRCPEHNARLGGGPAHPEGRAADIRIAGAQALILVQAATEFTGVGVKQTGPHGSRFIHLDTLPQSPRAPRPWIWSY